MAGDIEKSVRGEKADMTLPGETRGLSNAMMLAMRVSLGARSAAMKVVDEECWPFGSIWERVKLGQEKAAGYQWRFLGES